MPVYLHGQRNVGASSSSCLSDNKQMSLVVYNSNLSGLYLFVMFNVCCFLRTSEEEGELGKGTWLDFWQNKFSAIKVAHPLNLIKVNEKLLVCLSGCSVT